MVKFVTATFWLGKPFCPLPFLSDCWVTISVVMEWNGMETDMAHGLVTMVSTGRSDRVVRWWPMTMMYPPTSSPPTHSYVRPCLTHVLYRVLHGSPPSWWWWWMTVCVAIGWRDGPGMWTLNLDRWDHYYNTTFNATSWWAIDHDSTNQHANNNNNNNNDDDDISWSISWWIVNITVGKSFSVGASPSCSSIMKTNTRGPIVDQCEPGHQTVHSTPLIGSSLGMRRWYRFRRPICRAHDRPPSRTTKTATLFTNPATSWQIDVREYVNTLIVVDLSKPQIDWSIDRSDRLPTVSAHSLSLPLFTSTRISSFLPFNFSSRLFEIYSFLCIFSFSFEIVVLVWKIFEFLFKIILYLFLLYPGNS